MLRKTHVSYGFNDAKQFKMNFLCCAVYDTVAVTKHLGYTDQTYDHVVDIACVLCVLVNVNIVYFVPVP